MANWPDNSGMLQRTATRFLWLTFAVSISAAEFSVSWEPKRVVNGAPFVVRVHTHAPLQTLTGELLKSRFSFEYDRQAGIWWALAGIGYDIKPGKHTLRLEATGMDGQVEPVQQDIFVFAGSYPVSRIRVPQKYIKPPQEDVERIKAEREVKSKVFSEPPSPQRYWAFPFEAPVDSITTSPYGAQRVYNGVRRGVHTGLDFRAAEGTPVQAINRGKVLLARNFYYEGGFVLIDHGQGLMSMYMHLSAFDIKEGDMVERGQTIARSGGTGQSTAPHLHLGVRWQSLLLSPNLLLSLKHPEGQVLSATAQGQQESNAKK